MNQRHSSLRWAVVLAASCCVAVTTQGLSDPPAPKKSNLVTVRGCLNGRVLTVTERSGLTDSIRSLDLTGDKAMAKLLKGHSGQMEEVSGVLKSGAGNATPVVKEKTVGKNRFYVGAGSSTPPPNDASRPTIAVRDLTHLTGQCTS